MNLLSIVKNIGLNDKEARTYLACMEIGSSPVAKIADRAKLNRVTTYDILEKLIAKGLVHFFTKNGVRYFDATDPSLVAHEFKRKAFDFKKAVPELKKLRGDIGHPKVRYFENLDGIKTVYADSLTSKTEILNYANSREIRKHWPNYDEEYVKERVKRKIFLKGIALLDEYGLWVRSHDKENYREIRLIPASEFTFTNEINIYDDKVSIICFKEPLMGIIIESKEIADTQRDIFKMAFEFALHYQQSTRS